MFEFGSWSEFSENVEGLVFDEILQSTFAVRANKDEIIRLNTEDQLFKEGVNANNVLLSSIGGPYAPYTLELKQFTRSDVSPTRIDLRDTGAFYESFEVDNNFDHLAIDANTIKDGEDLRQRWGEEIIGLNEESIEMLGVFIQASLIKILVEKICE